MVDRALNLLGSIAFGVSAVAARIVPDSGDPRNLTVDNLGTFVGAICFLVGAFLLLVERAASRRPRAESADEVRTEPASVQPPYDAGAKSRSNTMAVHEKRPTTNPNEPGSGNGAGGLEPDLRPGR